MQWPCHRRGGAAKSAAAAAPRRSRGSRLQERQAIAVRDPGLRFA
jgi:hypothetical protein